MLSAPARTVEEDSEAAQWRPMKDAPKDRSILLRSSWGGEPVAIVGRYVWVHGSHCTLPMFGHDEHQIFANGWADLPDLGFAP